MRARLRVTGWENHSLQGKVVVVGGKEHLVWELLKQQLCTALLMIPVLAWGSIILFPSRASGENAFSSKKNSFASRMSLVAHVWSATQMFDTRLFACL